ncbi:MAG: alpha/beta fold hydrolase [Candidatus Helarchaeota archaeon]
MNYTVSESIFLTKFNRFYRNALKIPKHIVLSSFSNMTRKFSLEKELYEIEQPTLIIYGAQDKIISKNSAETLYQAIHNSKIVVIENGAHKLMMENYKEINFIIENFIKS